MFKPMIVFGTRPEAIKLAPVIKACLDRSDEIDAIVCSTGQHREMLKQVTDYFRFDIDRQLDLMVPNQSLSSFTAKCIEGVDQQVAHCLPNCILAQGDTATVLSAALVSFYRKIPFVHVEAGLRTGNLMSPWPEEMNRRFSSIVADFNCAPTLGSRKALLNEGVPSDKIQVTGNTVIDALLHTVAEEEARSDFWQEQYPELKSNRMVLITGHRRENFGRGLREVCEAISDLAETFPDVQFLYPVHLNPNVREPVHGLLGGVSNIHLRKPASYPEFVWLMRACHFLITDSGGIQEEAPSLGKPVLVTRDTTERPEAIEAGAAVLVGTNRERIRSLATELLNNPKSYSEMQVEQSPYGDGAAAERIVDWVLGELC